MIFVSLLWICRQNWLISADFFNKKECIFNFNGTTGTDGQKFPLINIKKQCSNTAAVCIFKLKGTTGTDGTSTINYRIISEGSI